MRTKIKVEKMPTILEDIIQDEWLPLGQKILKAGLKTISNKEIFERLECERLQKEEIEKRIKEIEKREDFVKLDGVYDDQFFYNTKSRECIMSPQFICEVKTLDIDHYLQEIPVNAIREIRKAKKLGLEKFEIHYPIIKEIPASKCPIITATLGSNKLFIIQY